MTLQLPKESPQSAQRVSTLVKRSDTPRFLGNEDNAIGGSNQTKTEAATSSVAAVSMDGLVAETPPAGVHVHRTFSEMSLTGRPFFYAVQVNAKSFDKKCCGGGCDLIGSTSRSGSLALNAMSSLRSDALRK